MLPTSLVDWVNIKIERQHPQPNVRIQPITHALKDFCPFAVPRRPQDFKDQPDHSVFRNILLYRTPRGGLIMAS